MKHKRGQVSHAVGRRVCWARGHQDVFGNLKDQGDEHVGEGESGTSSPWIMQHLLAKSRKTLKDHKQLKDAPGCNKHHRRKGYEMAGVELRRQTS